VSAIAVNLPKIHTLPPSLVRSLLPPFSQYNPPLDKPAFCDTIIL
jgi:hypothetical protein